MHLRLATLALAGLLAAGCCTLDHDQLAETAARRVEALRAVDELPDQGLTPAAFRQLAALEADAWEITRARALGEPVPAEVVSRSRGDR